MQTKACLQGWSRAGIPPGNAEQSLNWPETLERSLPTTVSPIAVSTPE